MFSLFRRPGTMDTMRTDANSDFAPTRLEDDDEPSQDAGFLSSLFGRLGVGAARRDPMTRLHSRVGLPRRGERLLARRAAGQDSALVLFDFSDLLETRGMYGVRVHGRALDLVVAGVRRLAGR